jgi:GntR family transcriptional regulator
LEFPVARELRGKAARKAPANGAGAHVAHAGTMLATWPSISKKPSSDGMPLYVHVAEEMLRVLVVREIADGAMLPSTRATAQQLRIAVVTARAAYARLQQMGCVAYRRGAQLRVHGKRARARFAAIVRERLMQAVRDERALGTSSSLLSTIVTDGVTCD